MSAMSLRLRFARSSEKQSAAAVDRLEDAPTCEQSRIRQDRQTHPALCQTGPNRPIRNCPNWNWRSPPPAICWRREGEFLDPDGRVEVRRDLQTDTGLT